MGQTLTHGIYLPDEGERNCYSGLAANWSILDGAVGTVAEHTSQIAGKAPAVHTHTKADITDFPAYGNTAGTICEGNDSRLSDARTPVAHTHGNIANDGKLTNGNRAVITGSDKAITESSVTDTELGYVAGVTSAIQTQLNTKAADTDVVHKTENETINSIKTFLQPMYEKSTFRFTLDSFVTGTPSNNLFYAPIAIGGLTNKIWNAPFQHNAAIRTTGISDYSIRVYSQISNTLTGVVTETNADASDISFRPIANANHNLGTSSYKWKSLNGVNPGALSLPDISMYDNVTSQVQPPTGESTINLQGGANTWTASADGYLVYVGRYNHFSQVYLYVANTYIGAQMSSDANSAPLYRFVSVPVCKNQVVQIQVYGTQFNNVYFYPNLGNV